MEEHKTEKDFDNPDKMKKVEPDTELKSLIVDYVGNNFKPEDGDVTIEMIIEILSVEFPELLMVIAEENWVRGYEQGIEDAAGMSEVRNNFGKKENETSEEST